MSATKTSEAFKAAKAEGLTYFWANTHVGGRYAFVGPTWEDGGFRTDADGHPTHDAAGNTVAGYGSEPLDATNAAHLAQCEEWYS